MGEYDPYSDENIHAHWANFMSEFWEEYTSFKFSTTEDRRRLMDSNGIKLILRMYHDPNGDIISANGNTYNANSFRELWTELSNSNTFKFITDLEKLIRGENHVISSSETESEWESDDEEMSTSDSNPGVSPGDIFQYIHSTNTVPDLYLLVQMSGDEGFGRSYQLLSGSQFYAVSEENLLRDFRYDVNASRTSNTLDSFEIDDEEAVDQGGFESWVDLRDWIESNPVKTREERIATSASFTAAAAAAARGSASAAAGGEASLGIEDTASSSSSAAASSSSSAAASSSSSATASSSSKRKANRKANVTNTRRRTRRRREPKNTNTTNKDNSGLVGVIRTLLAVPAGTQGTQGMRADLQVRAQEILLTEAPMTAEGPRWPELILGDVVKLINELGFFMLIGGGSLEPVGAAAEGERYYDFVSSRGDILRLGESDVPSMIITQKYHRDEIPTKFQNTLHVFEIEKLGLEIEIKHQHRLFNNSFNTRFYRVGEQAMLQRRHVDGSDATDAAADAEVARVEQLLADAKEAAARAAQIKRKKENEQWFDNTWKQELLDDQVRRGRAHMLLENKSYYTPAEAAEKDREVLRDVTTKKVVTTKQVVNEETGETETESETVTIPENIGEGEMCSICYTAVNVDTDPDDGVILGKPIRLNCKHLFHENCIKKWQTPVMQDNNTYQYAFDQLAHLVIKDQLTCPICRNATIDPTMRDGIYRFVKLRF